MPTAKHLAFLIVALAGTALAARAAEPITKSAKITLDPDSDVLVVDGKKVFPITLTIVPGPNATTPGGKHAYAEFADAGAMFMRTGGEKWTEETIEREKRVQQAAASGGMRCSPWLGWDLSNFDPDDKESESKLRRVIDTFKDSPGMGMWKGADEPDWGNSHNPKNATPEQVIHVGRIIREMDPNHPIWLVQAPRGTVASQKRYVESWDVGGIDIYPISYPPGVHSEEKNKEISMVGDFTQMMREIAGGKPYWMTLQIAFSGVVKPGRTLRMPTFPEQRFMAYQAIINGSRGLTYFGGGLEATLNDRDREYGYNWTYFDRVMRPLFDEFNTRSPILPALLAPDSPLKVTVAAEAPPKRQASRKSDETGEKPTEPKKLVQDEAGKDAKGIEFVVREVGSDVYVLACKREGPTVHVRFSGLPKDCTVGRVVFEEPRKVKAEDGSFTDWFGPFEVHVYKFSREGV